MDYIVRISLASLTLGYITWAVGGDETFHMCTNTTERISKATYFEVKFNTLNLSNVSSYPIACMCTLRLANYSTLILHQQFYFTNTSTIEGRKGHFKILYCDYEEKCDNETFWENKEIFLTRGLSIREVTYKIIQLKNNGYLEGGITVSKYKNDSVFQLDCHFEQTRVASNDTRNDITNGPPADITQDSVEQPSESGDGKDNANALILPIVVGGLAALLVGGALAVIICCITRRTNPSTKYDTQDEDSVVCYTSNLGPEEHQIVSPNRRDASISTQTDETSGHTKAMPEYAFVSKTIKPKITPTKENSGAPVICGAVDRSHRNKTKQPSVNKTTVTTHDVEYSDVIQAELNVDTDTLSENSRQRKKDDAIHAHDNPFYTGDDESGSKAVDMVENEVYVRLDTGRAAGFESHLGDKTDRYLKDN